MEARHDQVADRYAAGWRDDLTDPASTCLFRLLGPVAGLTSPTSRCWPVSWSTPWCVVSAYPTSTTWTARWPPSGGRCARAAGSSGPSCIRVSPGGADVSGSWPTGGRYYDEGWWRADGERSTLRRQVGAQHRTLATYLNALRAHGLTVDEVAEPDPEWAGVRADAGRSPVYLVVRCVPTAPRP